jgi:ribonuclease E
VIVMPLFQAPVMTAPEPHRRRAASRPAGPPPPSAEVTGVLESGPAEDDDFTDAQEAADALDTGFTDDDTAQDEAGDETLDARRRRRRRGGRGRRGRVRGEDGEDGEAGDAGDAEAGDTEPDEATDEAGDLEEDAEEDAEAGEAAGSRRRRRRRRRASGADAEVSPDDPPNTVVRVRDGRRPITSDDVTGLRGSTRLEAKKQRRREGREAGRRRPVITEAEFLARRESVERVMVVREREGRTQIGVLEDGVLVEHYVARRTQTSMVGNVFLGRVQNVLPSMEAAFVDIGKGRNAVLYAGEVNWDAAGLEGQPKRIEHALKSGESVLVQVTKDPIGHKGARLTSQISLPGRYLVYVPDGSMTGISRKLPDIERNRLKKVLREVVPENAGVIVRTAAEGASEEELARDVTRLQAHWEDISRKAGAVNAPNLLYGEPDLAIRVVRDIFNEDFSKLIVSGDDAWETLQGYIGHVAPDLVGRLERWAGGGDAFSAFRIDEQLAKALERKVWLPSGGSLVIDRTEAMTVVDVNTGKFTGAGGNLEETVTKNNIEAAEEIVRQLRLRDIGGIIVVDFIDMVLESNRDLVLRRLLECLGRDRTKHQVAEVTSLGLVQMTRKRVGSGLLEVFSETCEHCGGRGVIIHDEPVEKRQQPDGGRGRPPAGGSPGSSHGGAPGSGGSGNGAGHGAAGAGNGSPAQAPPEAGAATGADDAASEGTPASSGATSGGGRGRRRRGRGGSPSADSGDAPTLAAGA